MSSTRPSRLHGLRRNLLALGMSYLLAAAVIAAVVVGFVVIRGDEAAHALPRVTMGVGLVLMLTGGNLMERMTTLESSQWGISVNRHRDEVGWEYADVGELTSVGMAILVGIPLVVLGAMMLA